MSIQIGQWVLGIGPILLPRKGVVTVKATVNVTRFKATRFVVAAPRPSHLSLVGIHQIRFRGKEQMSLSGAAPHGCPASVFSPEAVDPQQFVFDDLIKGETIEVDVSCIDVLHVLRVEYDLTTMQPLGVKRFARRIRFSGVFFGPAQKEETS